MDSFFDLPPRAVNNVDKLIAFLLLLTNPSCYNFSSLQIYLFKKHLKLSSSDKLLNAHLLGDGLAQAFLKVMVCLLGKNIF